MTYWADESNYSTHPTRNIQNDGFWVEQHRGSKRKRSELDLPASVTTKFEKKYPAKVMITGGLTAFGICPNPPTNVGKYRRIRFDKRFHIVKVGRPK